ncbi:hypothetical protein MJO28_009330, partial [Puccinia striiformis f. sp. tritici]
ISGLSAIRDFGFTFAQQLEYQEFPSAQPTVWFDSQPDFPLKTSRLITTKHLNIHSSINCCRITQTHHLANQNIPLSRANLHPPSAKQLFSQLAQIPFLINRSVGFPTCQEETQFSPRQNPSTYHSNSPLTKPKHVQHSQLKGAVGLANNELLSRLAWTAFSLDLYVASSIVNRDAETTNHLLSNIPIDKNVPLRPETCAAGPGHQVLGKMTNNRRTVNAQSAAAVAYGETVVLKEVVFQLIFSVSEKYQQPITTASVKESIPDVTKSLTKTYKPVVDILQRFHASIEKFEKAFV